MSTDIRASAPQNVTVQDSCWSPVRQTFRVPNGHTHRSIKDVVGMWTAHRAPLPSSRSVSVNICLITTPITGAQPTGTCQQMAFQAGFQRTALPNSLTTLPEETGSDRASHLLAVPNVTQSHPVHQLKVDMQGFFLAVKVNCLSSLCL